MEPQEVSVKEVDWILSYASLRILVCQRFSPLARPEVGRIINLRH